MSESDISPEISKLELSKDKFSRYFENKVESNNLHYCSRIPFFKSQSNDNK